jgi:hypothetical protein
MIAAAESFVAEYECVWSCRIEFDLEGSHGAFRFSQMRRSVDACHRSVHEDPDYVPPDWFTVERNTEQER